VVIFLVTVVSVALAMPDGHCDTGAEYAGCRLPPTWALVVGGLGTLAAVATAVIGVVALLVAHGADSSESD
jgi:hypothetical protein